MFGRRKDDEEYIAPVEEYRDDGEYSEEYDGYSGGDCADHSHGSTYEVKEYRDDCSEHSHGQTYEDYNTDQSGYDRESELRSRFMALLEPGETIVWIGSADKRAKTVEMGTPGIMRVGWRWWLSMSIFMFVVMLFSGAGIFAFGLIPFAAFGLVFRAFGGDVRGWSYAITDRRVITLKKERAVSDYFWNIRYVRQFTSRNNRGYVTYQKVSVSENGIMTSTTNSGIFGINNPFAVYRTLLDIMSYGQQGR